MTSSSTRPVWKTLPIRFGVTIVVAVLLTASVLIVVLTGSVAEYVGDLVGAGATAVTVWTVVKWPVLVILISQILALLLGAEFDAELHRGRAIETGHPEDEEPFMALRDDRALDEDERA